MSQNKLQHQIENWAQFSDEDDNAQSSNQDNSTPLNQNNQSNTLTHQQFKIPENYNQPSFIQAELNKIKAKPHNVWLYLETQPENQLILDRKVKQMSENNTCQLKFPNKDNKKGWELKFNSQTAYKIMKDGIDQNRKIRICYLNKQPKNHDRDKKNGKTRYDRDHYDRPKRDYEEGKPRRHREFGDEDRDREHRGGRRGGRGRGNRHENNRNEEEPRKKPTYLNKQTRQKPTNKEMIEKKIMEDKQRHYTKTEADEKGKELGNFRNKQLPAKIQVHTDDIEVPKIPQEKIEYKSYKPKPEKSNQIWARKGTTKLDQETKLKSGDKPQVKYKQKICTEKVKSWKGAKREEKAQEKDQVRDQEKVRKEVKKRYTEKNPQKGGKGQQKNNLISDDSD